LVSAVVLSLVLSVTPHVPVHGGDDDGGVREAGPEDGILCCNGLENFLFHGDQVLVTTGRAGIFRSENRGAQWRRSMKGLVAPNGVSPFSGFVCQAPSQPRVTYALAGTGSDLSSFDGLFSSDDFGNTWTRRAPVPTGFGFARCLVDADDARTVYVDTFDADTFLGEVWKSTDGGRTVRRLDGLADLTLLTVVRGTAYFSTASVPGLFASTDGGITFQPVPLPPSFVQVFGFAASPDGRAIFVTTFDSDFNLTGTFRSTDRGASYVAVSGLPVGVFLDVLAFDPTDPSRIYATRQDLLRVSTDGGLSFAPLPASNDPRFVTGIGEIGVDPRGSVYLNTGGGPFRTDDGGQTFRSLRDGFRASSVQDLAFDANGRLLVGVIHTQTLFRETGRRAFRPIGNAPLIDVDGFNNDATSVAGSPIDANVLLVATNGQGLFRTDNGGRSWTPALVSGAPLFYHNSRMAFATSSRVYLASAAFFEQPGLYRSDDAGRTFTLLSSVTFGALAVDPTNPNILYVGDYDGDAGLFKSTDGGQTLQDLGRPGTFSALAVDPRRPRVVYAGERFGQVLRSLDGGQTFAPASAGLRGAGVHGLAQDKNGTLFVWLRGGGLFSSNDRASSWKPVDTGEALRRSGVEAGRGSLVVDPRHPGRVYLGNAGVIQIDVKDIDDGDHDD
jgi:photosystem II stability/assembly factor-like uncharacterized protein